MTHVDVRPAHRSDVRALAEVLGRAFYEDPVSVFVMPDANDRKTKLHKLFGAVTRHHHLAGGGVEVACDSAGTIGGAALWDPPVRWRQTRREELTAIPRLIWTFGRDLSRGRQLSDMMKDAHPEAPHWYLAVIGSDPTVRGMGFGQALMRSRLDRCDAEYAPAYLESSSPDNVPYYQRFGFEVTGEIVVPDGGPTLWPMWREPCRSAPGEVSP